MRSPKAALILTTMLGLATTAVAGEPSEQLRRYTDEVQRIVANDTMAAADKRASVRRVAEQVFDLAETARRALGPHWRKRTPAEQEEFVRLFSDLLDRTYISKIELYGGERLILTAETIDGDYAAVRAKIITRQGTEVPAEGRLHRRDGRWLVYDIRIEGVSLVGNYRSQFDRIIRTASWEELMRRLRVKREGPFEEGPGPGTSLGRPSFAGGAPASL
jgi:phospholipid transport system substrate-binding protein